MLCAYAVKLFPIVKLQLRGFFHLFSISTFSCIFHYRHRSNMYNVITNICKCI